MGTNQLGLGGYPQPSLESEDLQVELATIPSEEIVNPINTVKGQAVQLDTILSAEEIGLLTVVTGQTLNLDTIPSEEVVNPVLALLSRRDIFLDTIPSEEVVNEIKITLGIHLDTIPSEEVVNPIRIQQQITLDTIPSEEVVNVIVIQQQITLDTISFEGVVNPITALRGNKVELDTIPSEERVNVIRTAQSHRVNLDTIPSQEIVNPIDARFFVKVFLDTILSEEAIGNITVRHLECSAKGGILKAITRVATVTTKFAFCTLSRKLGYQVSVYFPNSGSYDEHATGEKGSVYNRADHKFRYGCDPSLTCVIMVFSNVMTLDRVQGDAFFDNIGLEPSYAFTESQHVPVNSIIEVNYHGQILRFFIAKIIPLRSIRSRNGEGVRVLELNPHN